MLISRRRPNTFLFSVIALMLCFSIKSSANFEALDSSFDGIEGTKVEGKAGCISCDREKANPAKTKNQLDLQDLRKVTNKTAGAAKPVNAARECISCDKVKLGKNGKVVLENSTDDVWSKYPEVMSYSNSDKVQSMVDSALSNSRYLLNRSGKGSRKASPFLATGYCFRHVKWALLRGGLTSKYLGGVRVNRPKRQAINSLEAEGFKNLLDDPKYSSLITNAASAPKGAVLVYEGGNAGGHIEIKTDFGTKGTYVSDFQAPQSVMQNELGGRASKNYRLIGVMIKPGG